MIQTLGLLALILGGTLFYSNSPGAYAILNLSIVTFPFEKRWIGRLIGGIVFLIGLAIMIIDYSFNS